jgi:hypothetical protein
MKTLLVLLTLLSSSISFGSSACKVDGISDSPQGMSCKFKNKEIKLTCQKGVYFLNEEPVSVAFHMEVETGSVPLVFQATTMTLTAIQLDKTYDAELSMGRSHLTGICQ